MANSKRPAPNEVLARVEASLGRWLRPGQTVAVGFSGGLDSTVLLHALKRVADTQAVRVQALHVHHDLSPNADTWAAFCQTFCESQNIPLTVERVCVGSSSLGTEAAARAARYAVFRAAGADAVMLAHHQDDQAETLLLQLLRGAGLKGLSAMAEARRMGVDGTLLLRPLLNVPRQSLFDYARRENLRWIEDESNRDTRFARNFMRGEILPIVQTRFPAYRRTLGRAAQHVAEASALLDAIAQEDLTSARVENALALDVVQRWPVDRAKNALRFWLERRGLQPPSARKLGDILRQLQSAQPHAHIAIAIGTHWLRSHRGLVSLEPAPASASAEFCVPWNGEAELDLPNGVRLKFGSGANGIDHKKLMRWPVTIRSRCGGERIKPDCRRPTRTLKNLLQEAGLPPWQRQRLPLVFCGETLVAVPGIGVQCDWRSDTTGVVVSFLSYDAPAVVLSADLNPLAE